MAKIVVKWEVEDGYCGGSRPHTTSFESADHDDEEWDALSEERKNEIIESEVELDFRNNIYFTIQSVSVR